MDISQAENLIGMLHATPGWQQASRDVLNRYGAVMLLDASTPVRVVGQTPWSATTVPDGSVALDTQPAQAQSVQCTVVLTIDESELAYLPFDSTKVGEFLAQVSEHLKGMLAKNIPPLVVSAQDGPEIITMGIGGREYVVLVPPGESVTLELSGPPAKSSSPVAPRLPALIETAGEKPPATDPAEVAGIMDSIKKAGLGPSTPEPEPAPPAPEAPPTAVAPASAPPLPTPNLAPVAPLPVVTSTGVTPPTPPGTDPSHVVKINESHQLGRRGADWFARTGTATPPPPVQEGAIQAPPRPQ